MPTINDVADRARVSTATVSHVINNSRRVSPDTRRRVEVAISELDFKPDPAGRALARHRGVSARRASAAAREEGGGGSIAQRRDAEAADATATGAQGHTTATLLRLVRTSQTVSRAELARRLGVHRATVTELVKPLIAEGLLRETEAAPPGESRLGRPATGLELTNESYLVGINLGVRQSHVGATTLGGRLLAESFFDTPREATDALRLMRSAVEDLRARVSGRALVSVGVSVPGPTCHEGRRLLFAPHLGWRDVDVAGALGSALDDGSIPPSTDGARGVPVFVENDARAAALYEARARCYAPGGEQWRDFILVRAGTGIGVGVVREGEVYRGADATDGWAGEFGHMTIVAGGKRCACGARGCWEAYASTRSAVALYTGERAALQANAPRFVEIVARARAGDVRARSTLARVGDYLGVGIANLIGGLGVSRVVVSGRVAHGWEFMRGALHESISNSMAGRLAEWTVEAGAPTGAGFGGALEVAADRYITGLRTKAAA